MVSGNSGEEEINFATLNDAEKRAVAERLLRIEQSGWKPFWCPISKCDGMPHRVTDKSGALVMVAESTVTGPQGEPVGGRVWETPGGDWVFEDDGEIGTAGDTPLGRVVHDPAWAHNHARVDQRLPGWLKPWTLFIMSGRGTGKTRTGVEFVTLSARKGLNGAILGRRGTELVNTHVAAIIEHAHPDFMPIHWASKDILEWPNGAITYLFSAEKPENIRSVNLSYAWVDEAAFMDEIDTAWMNLKLATRIETPGNPIHFLITSTPTSTKWVMEMEDDPDVEVRRVATYANRANLSPSFLADLRKKYEGTRMGRQELYGEVLRDVEGALWNDDIFSHLRIDDPSEFFSLCESMDDIVVAVDPAGSSNKRSDETGIIVVGVQNTDDDGTYLDASRFYVLADATLKGTPTEWARQVYKAAYLTRARRIIAEKNFGGEMVKQTLVDFAKTHPLEAITTTGDNLADTIKVVHAVDSKETRAESVVGKYEQGRVQHVPNKTLFGDLSTLEKEQTTWVPKSRGGRKPSPNRIDALVWAVRALETAVRFTGSVATSAATRSRLKTQSYPEVGSTITAPTPVIPEAKPRPEPVRVPAPKPVYSAPADKKWPTKPKRPAGVHRR